MKRFKITRKSDGQKFNWEDESFPTSPSALWGKPAHQDQIPILDQDGNPVLDAEGKPTFTVVDVPSEFDVVVEDMSAELTAKAAAQAKRDAAKAAVAALDWSKVNTVAELKVIVKAMLERE